MIYDLTLKIASDYAAAVKDARHVLRIRPRDGAAQAILSQSLKVLPQPDESAIERDFFGNAVDHVLLRRAHEALTVEMRARVRVAPNLPDLDATPALAALRDAALGSRDVGPLSPVHFLASSRLVPRSAVIGEHFRDALDSAGAGGSALLALTRRIHDEFTYAPGSTRIDTPVDTVFRTRKGVCQDFAHLAIAGLRALGIPAAYVSGFLRTLPPPGQARLEGADAMHAWVKVWLGEETGWVGFDPTNGVVTAADHVEVAIGRDYADVAPIGGVFITAGPQRSRHSVDVVPVDDPDPTI
jgi:transglutaminase-like putative cysteine protease